jgi:hypothetical protein
VRSQLRVAPDALDVRLVGVADPAGHGCPSSDRARCPVDVVRQPLAERPRPIGDAIRRALRASIASLYAVGGRTRRAP